MTLNTLQECTNYATMQPVDAQPLDTPYSLYKRLGTDSQWIDWTHFRDTFLVTLNYSLYQSTPPRKEPLTRPPGHSKP